MSRRAVGRFFQACGLVLAPMALLYYFDNSGWANEGELAKNELLILASAAGIFILGRIIERH